MKMPLPFMMAPGVLAVVAAACTTAMERAPSGRDTARPAHTEADVHFMLSMIRHHGQAVLMAGWAPTHGASQSVRTASERILVAQQDEIAHMERWLRERDEAVPDADPSHATGAHGADHAPGMLTAEQLAQLDGARGSEFDRLFLTFMIQHHQGAITMVEELFRAPGAAQDETVFQFAADVSADQAAEIDRLNRMLANLPTGGI